METKTPAPAPPLDAATVVVVRQAAGGIELFGVERHRRSGFMGGALVFPGGKVDPADHGPDWEARTTPLGPRARAFADDPVTARAFAVAVLREALEEAALLPVVGDLLDTDAVLALRAELARGGRPEPGVFAELVRARDLTLDTARLEALSRWITPTAEPRRFDTRFYLMTAPPSQAGAHDDHETTKSLWATPEDLLRRWEEGRVVLAPPTAFTIALFVGVPDVASAHEVARRQSLSPLLPCFVEDGPDMVLTLPGDPLHPDREAPAAYPDAPTRFVWEGSRLVPRRP